MQSLNQYLKQENKRKKTSLTRFTKELRGNEFREGERL